MRGAGRKWPGPGPSAPAAQLRARSWRPGFLSPAGVHGSEMGENWERFWRGSSGTLAQGCSGGGGGRWFGPGSSFQLK